MDYIDLYDQHRVDTAVPIEIMGGSVITDGSDEGARGAREGEVSWGVWSFCRRHSARRCRASNHSGVG